MLRPRILLSPRARARFSTLTPSKLQPTDWVDFSKKERPYIFYHPPGSAAEPERVSGTVYFRSPDGAVLQTTRIRTRWSPLFPEWAAGFLYVHSPAGHPAAREVRLRCVPTADPTLFAEGGDLLLSTGLPWAIHFFGLGKKRNSPLRTCLVQEGFVRDAELRQWEGALFRPQVVVVVEAGQPFILDFASTTTTTVSIADGYSLHSVKLRDLTSCGLQPRIAPYEGSAHCAFEYRSEHRDFVLRFLRMIHPPTPNPAARSSPNARLEIVSPKAGDLLMKPHRISGPLSGVEPRPRIFDPREQRYRALRYLMPPVDRVGLERELAAGLDLVAESERTIGDDEELVNAADLPVKSELTDAKTAPSPTT